MFEVQGSRSKVQGSKSRVSCLASLGLCLASRVLFAAGQAEIAKWDPAMAQENAVVADGVKWIDGKFLPIEGRAFDDVDHYYDRLPKNVTTNVNEGVRAMKHHTAGMQFRFTTDSKSLTFKWVPYNSGLAMDHMPSTGVSGIDVYRFDAAKGKWIYVKTGRIWDAAKGGVLAVKWTPGTPCLVNLPLYNGIRSFTLGIDPAAKVEALPPRKSGVVKPVVFYGTSITHGGCCSRPGLAFPSVMGRDLDVPIVNLGFSGSGQGELEMSEHLAAIDASCYVIDCVWNMSGDLMPKRYEKFVRNLRRLRPDVPIVMAEGCDVYCDTEQSEEIRVRSVYVKPAYDKFVAEGWKKLYFLPAKGQHADDFEGTVDGVHPNDWGMMHIARAFGAVVREALNLK